MPLSIITINKCKIFIFDRLAQVVKITVSLGMWLTFPLQFFVPIQIIWPHIQQKFGPFKNPMKYELLFRSFMVLLTCTLLNVLMKWFEIIFGYFFLFFSCYSWACTEIKFIHFLDWCIMRYRYSFCYYHFRWASIYLFFIFLALALVFPPVIQLISAFGTSEGPGALVLIKNSVILSIALLGFSTGTYESLSALAHAFFDWPTIQILYIDTKKYFYRNFLAYTTVMLLTINILIKFSLWYFQLSDLYIQLHVITL